jgi:hypothetical protein
MPKTLAIRLDDALHSQASLIAQLEGISLTELIRTSIERYLDDKRNDPALASKADAVREEIEAEAANRQAAIQTLFADNEKPAPKPARGRTRKASDPGS